MGTAEDLQRDERIARWLADLESRHLADLRFAEVSRALRALSSAYVERRDRLSRGAALDGAGKRAAFALFYGPLHFFALQRVVRALGAAEPALGSVVDLGCGTGVAGAAWALECVPHASVTGVDLHPWAVGEARCTLEALALHGTVRRADVAQATLPTSAGGIVAAFTLNELPDEQRSAVLARLLHRASSGTRVLVVEPIAKRMSPWWDEASRLFLQAGGRDDEWRFAVTLPPIVKRLDRAAGLRHAEVTARSLFLQGPGIRGQATPRPRSEPAGDREGAGIRDQPHRGLRPEWTEM